MVEKRGTGPGDGSTWACRARRCLVDPSAVAVRNRWVDINGGALQGGQECSAVPKVWATASHGPDAIGSIRAGAQLGVSVLERSPVPRQLRGEPQEVDGELDRAAARSQDPPLLVNPGLDREGELSA